MRETATSGSIVAAFHWGMRPTPAARTKSLTGRALIAARQQTNEQILNMIEGRIWSPLVPSYFGGNDCNIKFLVTNHICPDEAKQHRS